MHNLTTIQFQDTAQQVSKQYTGPLSLTDQCLQAQHLSSSTSLPQGDIADGICLHQSHHTIFVQRADSFNVSLTESDHTISVQMADSFDVSLTARRHVNMQVIGLITCD